jgi:heat shock protein HspQ
VIFDIDPEFANTDEWYESIPEDRRPRKDSRSTTCSPKNAEIRVYRLCVGAESMLPDESGVSRFGTRRWPKLFEKDESGSYRRATPFLN